MDSRASLKGTRPVGEEEIVNANIGVAADVLGDLLVGSGKGAASGIASAIVKTEVGAEADGYGIWVPTCLLRQGAEQMDFPLQFVGFQARGAAKAYGQPGVAQFGGTSYGRAAMPSDPYRDAVLLNGSGREVVSGSVSEPALELGERVSPELAEEGNIFIRHTTSFFEGRGVKGFELLLHPTGADTEDHAPTGEEVQS